MARFEIEIPGTRYFEKLVLCREACPVHTDGRGYVQAVARGDYELAYRIARGPNPFASICGRICGAPCEKACRRAFLDAPVAIRAIKRSATERHGVEALTDPRASLALSLAPGSVTPAPREGSVAVIGAGVGGLTCAHDLARLGYRIAVYEADEQPGGMLRTGVPIYRLPKQVWQREIEAILALGIELRTGVSVGRDVTLAALRELGHDAVVLAVGLQRSRPLELPGKELPGILGGLDFLHAFNARHEFEPFGRVVVIGGGNVAYDCARSALRVPGTVSSTLVCLEALHEMPADELEIVEAEEEGVLRLNRRGPVRFVEAGGRIGGLQTRACSRVFDEQGRFAPELTPGSEAVLDCDTIIVAVGQAADPGFATGLPELQLGRGGGVIADRATGATSLPWVFAVGDVAMGPGLFIDAVAHGQRAAASVHRFLSAKPEPMSPVPPERAFEPELPRQGMRTGYLRLPRRHPPAVEPGERLAGAERQVERPYTDAEARSQGARCLRCEVETVFDGSRCILCGGCADVCPTWCLRLVSTAELGLGPAFPVASAIIKDEERCVRCAMCVERCPTDAIAMERLCGFEPWAAGGTVAIADEPRCAAADPALARQGDTDAAPGRAEGSSP